MTIRLDHIQRLNLVALLGAQRGNLDTIRALWKLQDKFDLDEQEKQAIGLEVRLVNGQEIRLWHPEATLPDREFQLSDQEVERLRSVLRSWDDFEAAGTRRWLEPLLEQLGL
jgi:hypothetical protein